MRKYQHVIQVSINSNNFLKVNDDGQFKQYPRNKIFFIVQMK